MVKKHIEHRGGSKGGSKSGGILVSAPIQKQVLAMLTSDEPLTIKQIANRRQTSVRAVNLIVEKLKNKGLLTGSSYRGFQTGAHCNSRGVPNLSLHAQRFTIGVKAFTTAYAEQQYMGKMGNKGFYYRGQCVKFRSGIVEIYSTRHFKARTGNDVLAKQCLYWNTFIDGLQSKYGLVLDLSEIKEVYAEVAMLNNGIALRQNKLNDRIFYYDDEGKLWLKTDKSFRGNDLEFVGTESTTALGDAERFERHLRDWRDPECASPLMFQRVITDVVKVLSNQQQQSLNIPENIEDIKRKHKELPSYFG